MTVGRQTTGTCGLSTCDRPAVGVRCPEHARVAANTFVGREATRVAAGKYEVVGADGVTYRVERDYGVGSTTRGWSAFTQDGARWVGTRYSGETLREVVRQLTTPARGTS